MPHGRNRLSAGKGPEGGNAFLSRCFHRRRDNFYFLAAENTVFATTPTSARRGCAMAKKSFRLRCVSAKVVRIFSRAEPARHLGNRSMTGHRHDGLTLWRAISIIRHSAGAAQFGEQLRIIRRARSPASIKLLLLFARWRSRRQLSPAPIRRDAECSETRRGYRGFSRDSRIGLPGTSTSTQNIRHEPLGDRGQQKRLIRLKRNQLRWIFLATASPFKQRPNRPRSAAVRRA